MVKLEAKFALEGLSQTAGNFVMKTCSARCRWRDEQLSVNVKVVHDGGFQFPELSFLFQYVEVLQVHGGVVPVLLQSRVEILNSETSQCRGQQAILKS